MEKVIVLFVDDEMKILDSLKRGLMDQDFRSKFAIDAKHALDILKKEEIGVIVTDMRMPGMNGIELLKIVKEQYPDTVRVVLSGYTQLPQVFAAINQGYIFKFIPKPWNLNEELIPVINDSIDYYNVKKSNRLLMEELNKKNQMYKKIIKSTKDLYDQYHNDIARIQKVSSYFFDSLKSTILRDNTNKNILNFYQDLFMDYIKTFPTKLEKFNFINILENLEKNLKKSNQDCMIKINIDKTKKYYCYDNYNLLYFVMTAIYRFMFKHDYTNTELNISIEDSENAFKADILLTALKQTDYKLIEPAMFLELISIITNDLNGELKVNESETKIIINFRFELKKTQ